MKANKFLVTYRIYHDDCPETFAEMMSTDEIGRLYGFSDCTDVCNVRVFKISDEGTPIEVDIDPEIGRTVLFLVDRETKMPVASCFWNEH